MFRKVTSNGVARGVLNNELNVLGGNSGDGDAVFLRHEQLLVVDGDHEGDGSK